MSSKKQILGAKQSMDAAAAGAPTGDVGIELAAPQEIGNMRPTSYLFTFTVSGGPADVVCYGCVMDHGAVDTPADDDWGLINDRYGHIVSGLIKAALPTGVHHFVVEDVGIYTRLYFTKSANTVAVDIRPMFFTDYGS